MISTNRIIFIGHPIHYLRISSQIRSRNISIFPDIFKHIRSILFSLIGLDYDSEVADWIGDEINLELPLKYGQKISGHICQGQVDTVAKLINLKKIDKSIVLEFGLNKNYLKFLVKKASILINGVSLTISNIKQNSFEIWIIPHTLKLTNLSNIKKNDLVNVEIDILSKYIKKFINEKKLI